MGAAAATPSCWQGPVADLALGNWVRWGRETGAAAWKFQKWVHDGSRIQVDRAKLPKRAFHVKLGTYCSQYASLTNRELVAATHGDHRGISDDLICLE
jgi:hypothetical protein